MANDEGTSNGAYHCPVGQEWEEFRNEFREARKNCRELNSAMELILKNTGYLVKLPELTESVATLNHIIKEMKDSLLAPAIGKDQVPKEILEFMLSAQNKNSRYIFWLLGSIIVAFVIIFGFLLTGEKTGYINPLARKIVGVP